VKVGVDEKLLLEKIAKHFYACQEFFEYYSDRTTSKIMTKEVDIKPTLQQNIVLLSNSGTT
jgi:hypothetical protein